MNMYLEMSEGEAQRLLSALEASRAVLASLMHAQGDKGNPATRTLVEELGSVLKDYRQAMNEATDERPPGESKIVMELYPDGYTGMRRAQVAAGIRAIMGVGQGKVPEPEPVDPAPGDTNFAIVDDNTEAYARLREAGWSRGDELPEGRVRMEW